MATVIGMGRRTLGLGMVRRERVREWVVGFGFVLHFTSPLAGVRDGPMIKLLRLRPGAILRAIIRAEILFGFGFFAGTAFGGFWRGFGQGMGWWSP